jgi:hypothetical protein
MPYSTVAGGMLQLIQERQYNLALMLQNNCQVLTWIPWCDKDLNFILSWIISNWYGVTCFFFVQPGWLVFL